MKKIIFFILCISLISFVYSLDENLVVSCGGSEELVIGCLGNEDLFFIGKEIETSGAGTVSEEKEKIFLDIFSISVFGYDIEGIYVVIGISLIIIFFLLLFIEEERRRKRKRKI